MAAPTDRWLGARPAEQLISAEVHLRRALEGDAAALVEAVNESLDHLRPWMSWAAQPATDQSVGRFLRSAAMAWEASLEFQYLICEPGAAVILGGCGLHAGPELRVLEVGYWVHAAHGGRGLATAAARALTVAALGLVAVDRLEIHCDQANLRSAAIPATLGYRLLRIEYRPPEAPAESGARMVWALEQRGAKDGS